MQFSPAVMASTPLPADHKETRIVIGMTAADWLYTWFTIASMAGVIESGTTFATADITSTFVRGVYCTSVKSRRIIGIKESTKKNADIAA